MSIVKIPMDYNALASQSASRTIAKELAVKENVLFTVSELWVSQKTNSSQMKSGATGVWLDVNGTQVWYNLSHLVLVAKNCIPDAERTKFMEAINNQPHFIIGNGVTFVGDFDANGKLVKLSLGASTATGGSGVI
jgi:hypothetical protein